MDITGQIIAFENGELNQDEVVEFFIKLYRTGILFQLQGFYQRCFKDLIDNNLINIKELETERRI